MFKATRAIAEIPAESGQRSECSAEMSQFVTRKDNSDLMDAVFQNNRFECKLSGPSYAYPRSFDVRAAA